VSSVPCEEDKAGSVKADSGASSSAGEVKEVLAPYPATSFIGPASLQSTQAFVPSEQMCLVDADVTWDRIMAADKRIVSKARSIEVTNYLLSITEAVKVCASRP
jgi:hypothetical protein